MGVVKNNKFINKLLNKRYNNFYLFKIKAMLLLLNNN